MQTPKYELSFNGATFDMRLHLLTRAEAIHIMDVLGMPVHPEMRNPSAQPLPKLHHDQSLTNETIDWCDPSVMPAEPGPFSSDRARWDALTVALGHAHTGRRDPYATVADAVREASAKRTAALSWPSHCPVCGLNDAEFKAYGKCDAFWHRGEINAPDRSRPLVINNRDGSHDGSWDRTDD